MILLGRNNGILMQLAAFFLSVYIHVGFFCNEDELCWVLTEYLGVAFGELLWMVLRHLYFSGVEQRCSSI